MGDEGQDAGDPLRPGTLASCRLQARTDLPGLGVGLGRPQVPRAFFSTDMEMDPARIIAIFVQRLQTETTSLAAYSYKVELRVTTTPASGLTVARPLHLFPGATARCDLVRT